MQCLTVAFRSGPLLAWSRAEIKAILTSNIVVRCQKIQFQPSGVYIRPSSWFRSWAIQFFESNVALAIFCIPFFSFESCYLLALQIPRTETKRTCMESLPCYVNYRGLHFTPNWHVALYETESIHLYEILGLYYSPVKDSYFQLSYRPLCRKWNSTHSSTS